jgi:spore maturation protein CgeB
MDGFKKETGYDYITIPLAADKMINFPEFSEKFKADISYVGTYLPEKKDFIQQYVFPLRQKYDLQLYGQDWTLYDQTAGFVQKVGQYFNIPIIRSLQKPKLQLEDERRIYNSSLFSINIHEEYQKKFGGDCNERTFKIPLCGGFEITDDVQCIRKYFKEGEEIVIAKNKEDWFSKIEYYTKNPDKRLSIIEAGRKKVLAEHTYHNRVEQIVGLYNSIK